MDTPDEAPQALWRRVADLLHDEFWWPKKMSPARLWGLAAMTSVMLGTQAALLWALTSYQLGATGPLLVTLLVTALLVGSLVFVAEYEDDDPE